MAARKLTLDPTGTVEDGKVTFHLELSGSVDEGDIHQELMPVFYRLHPALDDDTGRLKQQQGVRTLMSDGPEFFLTRPDALGASHLGGIRIPVVAKDQFIREIRDLGWVVET